MLKGFHENFMVFNPNKCRFMVVGDQIIPAVLYEMVQ